VVRSECLPQVRVPAHLQKHLQCLPTEQPGFLVHRRFHIFLRTHPCLRTRSRRQNRILAQSIPNVLCQLLSMCPLSYFPLCHAVFQHIVQEHCPVPGMVLSVYIKRQECIHYAEMLSSTIINICADRIPGVKDPPELKSCGACNWDCGPLAECLLAKYPGKKVSH
jgi:hypothetical protein